MPSPLAHALLPASCLLSARRKLPRLERGQLVRLFLAGALIASLPDIDYLYPQLHRSLGHNIFALGIWALLGRWILTRFVSPELGGRRGLVIAASLAGSHLFLDALAHFNEMWFQPAVPLFWPLTSRHFTLPIRLFVTLDPSMPFWQQWLWGELYPCLLLFGAWATGSRLYDAYARRRRGDAYRLSSLLVIDRRLPSIKLDPRLE